MTREELQWFEDLTKDREESARVHEKPSERGYWSSVVDKYSDQAHFIYELLQNADDAKATYANFTLRPDGLIFSHNGEIRFFVSDPETEEEDAANYDLGCVNSICSIGNSTKTEQSIGKFGVGFKAVFQYSQTPHIYDPDIKFKLERFIVPMQLEADWQERKNDETLFWFPFDHEDEPKDSTIIDSKKKLYFSIWKGRQKCAYSAYKDISEKLPNLDFPTLFLNSLQNVSYKIYENEKTIKQEGDYLKYSEQIKCPYDFTAESISLISKADKITGQNTLLLFSRTTRDNNYSHSYSVGFFIKNDKLLPVDHTAFCYFPTKENTNLNFIIHGPFLLTDSREGIKANEYWNKELINKLALLAADSLLLLRDKKLIDDNIFDIVPYKEDEFNVNALQKLSFKLFYARIKEKFFKEFLLPAKDGYVSKNNAYWHQDNPVIDLFDDIQLGQLIGNKSARWVFRTLPRNKTDKDNELRDYIDDCINDRYDMDKIVKEINADFIERQPLEWLHGFYAYLYDNNSYIKIVRKLPIFLDQDKKAALAYDGNDQRILFLSNNGTTTYKTIYKELLTNNISREFIISFGISDPDICDEVIREIFPKYNNVTEIPKQEIHNEHLRKIAGSLKTDSILKKEKIIKLMENTNFLKARNCYTKISYKNLTEIYNNTVELREYFYKCDDAWLLDEDIDKETIDVIINTMETNLPKRIIKGYFTKGYNREGYSTEGCNIKETQIIENSDAIKQMILNQYSKVNATIDFKLHGLSELLIVLGSDNNSIAFGKKKKKAVVLWHILKKHLERDPHFFDNQYYEFYRTQKTSYQHESIILKLLNENQWILTKNDGFKKPSEVTVSQLYEGFQRDNDLINALGIMEKNKETIQEEILEKHAEALGITLNDVANIKLIQDNPIEFERFKEDMSKRKTCFPVKSVKNREHRANAMQEQISQAEDKLYEVRKRKVRVTAPGDSPKTFLEDNYTNEDGIMVCQLCRKTMPFKKKDDTYYYEAVECLSRDHLKKEMPGQYLALCPECSAWYNEWILHDKEAIKKLKESLQNAKTNDKKNEIELPNKGENWQTIKFTENHLFDLKEILKDND
jgi:hypothetical protein